MTTDDVAREGQHTTAGPAGPPNAARRSPAPSEDAATGSRPSGWRAAGWWTLTLVTLVVLDDLTFGPVFWILSRNVGASVAMAVAFVVYLGMQVFIVFQGTAPKPHRLAAFFLHRLLLTRRNPEIAKREIALHDGVAGALAALLLSPVIGGVLPPLLLWKKGYGRRDVRRLAVPCAAIYAAEFSIVHGFFPSFA